MTIGGQRPTKTGLTTPVNAQLNAGH